MQLKQLINALKYIDTTLQSNNFVDLYQELVTSLNQARENPSPEATNNIIRLRETIVELHKASEPIKWTYAQRKLYQKFGVRHLLGSDAADDIDNIFIRHSADPSGAASSINELTELTNLLKQRVHTVIEGLGPLADDTEIEIEEGKTSIQLFFEDAASIDTMQDLEDHGGRWNNILRAFSRLTKVSAEDAKIVTIEQGSLLIGLSAIVIVVLAIAKASNEILAVYERYLTIKRLALEASNLKLRNEQIANQIESEAQETIDTTAVEVAQKLMNEHNWSNERNIGEVKNAVEMSVKHIFEFVRDGGKIDVYEPDPTTTETTEQLREAFTRIRAIEGTIEQLALPQATQNSNSADESTDNESPD